MQALSSDFISKLAEVGEHPPSEVCGDCARTLQKTLSLSSGGVLLAQEKAKGEHRLQLWKSRVGLIKKARAQMDKKLFSEAAVYYEKYLKILELVFECKEGQALTPTMFKDSARTSELTVLASVYWDLLCIYDSSEKFIDRQQNAAKQLGIFVNFTPIYPDIIRRAQSFAKTAKHPQVFKSFLKTSAQERPRCYIATAVYNDSQDIYVQTLRWFRDYHLRKSVIGRSFIYSYERLSPYLVRRFYAHRWLRVSTKLLLNFFVKMIRVGSVKKS